jgi:hypothetical protein
MVRPSGTEAPGARKCGQADLLDDLRARVSCWPPLRLARFRRERESVGVVSPTAPVRTERRREMRRVIGIDNHRTFGEVVIWEGRRIFTRHRYIAPPASGWSSPTSLWGFPCYVRFPCVCAAATPRCNGWASSSLISPGRRVNHSLGKRPIMSATPESQPASSPKSFKPEPRSRPKRRLYPRPSPNPTESREAAIVFCICAEGFFCSAALDRADTCHSVHDARLDRTSEYSCSLRGFSDLPQALPTSCVTAATPQAWCGRPASPRLRNLR